LNFPQMDQQANNSEEQLQLQVMILDDRLVVADNKGGVIKQIKGAQENTEVAGTYNFELLGKVMQEIKARVPDKKDITIMAKKKTSYQTLVTVMDKVRSFPTVVAGSVVHAELFPEISIADAPQVVDLDAMSDKNGNVADAIAPARQAGDRS